MADQVLQSPKNPHFFQPLLPGFDSHLKIPVKFFSVHIQGRNERNTVELRSDASEKTWNVQMDGRRLTVGWKEFTESHDFRIGDVIIFRHEGDFVFHISCFGPSCCEIQYEQNNITSSTKFVRSNGLKKGCNKIVLTNGVTTQTLNLRFRETIGTFFVSGGWRSFCHENELKAGDSVKFKLERNNTKTPLLRCSNSESKCSKGKRKETGESSQRVSSSFSSSLSENRFVTLNVTLFTLKDSRLYLPIRFTSVHKMETAKGKKITLLDQNGVEWPVSLLMDTGNMYLRTGLNEFLEAIGVKESESFVLELIWEDTTTPPMLKFCSEVKT